MLTMPQDEPIAGTQAVVTSPQDSGENDDIEMQDIKCDVCDKVFTRSEHLRRHKRAHSAEKPFACIECKKRFARQDILRRHRASHDLKRQENASDSIRRYARACFACAIARVKCLRGKVCQRCRSRGLQCEYPSRRSNKRTPRQSTIEIEFLDSSETTSEEGGQGDEQMSERDDNGSSIIVHSGENGSTSEVFRSVPKESTWANHLLAAIASNPTSVGESWNASSSEVTLAAAGAVQTPLSGESPMSARDQLFSESFVGRNEPIIPGAQLIPQVSEGNIGSLYNYSRINWLPPNDLTHIDQTFRLPPLQSAESSSVSAQDAFNNRSPDQNMQSSPRLATAGHFEDSYRESYASSRPVGLISGRSKSFSLDRMPSIVAVGTRPDAPVYYVDGDDARLPIPTSDKRPNHSSISLFAGQSNNSLNPTIHNGLERIHPHLPCDYTHARIWVSEESYIALTEYLKYKFGRGISLSHTDSFPSLEELNEFARLYFDKFHDSFPLLHKATFLNNRDGCLLELAISAIGACYVGTFYARQCSESLHELVHNLLEIASASDYDPSEFPGVFGLRRPGYPHRLTRLQARILNVLGMFHSGNPKLAGFAREDRAILVTTCIGRKMLVSNHYDGWQAARGTEEEGEHFLQQWLDGELKCRAGYFIWMLDCMMAYESDFRSHMDLSDGKAPLPCPEQIWNEPMLNKAQILILNNGPPSLCLALDVLYIEKRLLPNLGELSRILLIHGMYRRVWEVARYHSDSLSDWVPTALSEHHHIISPEKTTTPSAKPVVSSWTNGSCDCLDVLHWSAQSMILQASGLEHPTILHLHLARLILLAPVSDLQELAKAKLHRETRSRSEGYLYPTMQEQSLLNSLFKWVAHDQYKARLAIIHAGSVFWHLRRYSCGAVIEPFANYLATLVLWAYSVSTSAGQKLQANSPRSAVTYEPHVDDIETSQANETSRHSQDGLMESRQPNLEDHSLSDYYSPSPLRSQISGALEQLEGHETSLIQLDRPCDDELVQLFVRFGERMTPYMARIGDIKSRDSAGKILREGIKLLTFHGNKTTGLGGNGSERLLGCTWGAAETYSAMLSALGAVS